MLDHPSHAPGFGDAVEHLFELGNRQGIRIHPQNDIRVLQQQVE